VGLRRIHVDRPDFLGPVLQKVEDAAPAGTDRDQALPCLRNEHFDFAARVLVAGRVTDAVPIAMPSDDPSRFLDWSR